jgi:cytochrome c-type biogenesis protein CcmH/NrfG
MKKNTVPDSHQKRKLLYDKNAQPERLISFGEIYLRDGRVSEAAELFSRASHEKGMAALRALALEQGDSFLYRVASKGSKDADSPLVWEALGKRAMDLKKYSHAVRAFRKAGDEGLLKIAEEALKEVLSIDKA